MDTAYLQPGSQRYHKAIVALLLIFFVIVFAGRGLKGAAADDVSLIYTTDELIVRLQPGVDVAEINAAYDTATIRALPYSDDIYLLQVSSEGDTLALAAMMSGDGRFQYAEPNFRNAAPEATGVDTYGWGVDTYGWGVDTYGWGVDTYGWGIDTYGWGEDARGSGIDTYGWPSDDDLTISSHPDPRVVYNWTAAPKDLSHYYNQPAVHQIHLDNNAPTGAGVIVAVLDTGIDASHPLLAPYLTSVRYDFVDNDLSPDDEFNGLDDDGDGFIDEIAGHGTHIAGIVHRVAPQAQIMPLRVLDSDGQGDSFIIAEAMLYAVQHGATIINMSLGTVWTSTFLQDVVQQVTAQGALVVAAAGNLGTDIAQYPAASDCALGVTAVGPGMQKAEFASYGVWVDLAAPGERVYSTYPGGYSWWQGTSMATPFVSGQAALLRGLNPALSPTDLAQIIAGTAQSVDAANQEYEGELGYGRIDINDSLALLSSGGWATMPNPLQACTP